MKKFKRTLLFYYRQLFRVRIADNNYLQVMEVYDLIDEKVKPKVAVNYKGEIVYGSAFRSGIVEAVCDIGFSDNHKKELGVEENFVLPIFGIATTNEIE